MILHGLEQSTMFILNGKEKLSINITAIDDKIDNDNEDEDVNVSLKFICNSLEINKNLLIYNLNYTKNYEHQFEQNIIDFNRKSLQRICYNLIGMDNNEYINIFRYNETETNVYCKFINKKMINDIKIEINSNDILIIKPMNIYYNNEKLLSWEIINEFRNYRQNNFIIHTNFNNLHIQCVNKLSCGGVSFLIKRYRIRELNYSLRIFINGLDNYNGVDGIFGRLGNSNFEFPDNYNENGEYDVIINENKVKSNKSFVNYSDCWIMNIDHDLTD